MAPEAAGDEGVERLALRREPVSEPSRLLMAEVGKAIIPLLILSLRVGLTMTDKNDFAHDAPEYAAPRRPASLPLTRLAQMRIEPS